MKSIIKTLGSLRRNNNLYIVNLAECLTAWKDLPDNAICFVCNTTTITQPYDSWQITGLCRWDDYYRMGLECPKEVEDHWNDPDTLK